MQKIFYVFVALLLSTTSLYAQAPKIEKGEGFDEPRAGYNKVLLMKNGYTLYFNMAGKDGLQVDVYDKARKLVSSKELESDLWDTRRMSMITVAGLFEINNQAVMFVVVSEGRVPTLYRMQINGTTGAKIKEDELGSTAKTKLFAMVKETNSIFVEKDPSSDCYAAIFFNGYAKDPDDRIAVMHFDGSHKKITEAYYDSPDENFKYLRYIGAVVDGAQRMYISTYGAGSLNGRDGKVFVSMLKAGSKTFTNKSLTFSEDFKDTKSVMTYNHNDNSIQMLTMSFASGQVSFFGGGVRTQYLSFLSFIDPESLELKSVKPIAGQKINEYAHKMLNTEVNYKGLPQQMIINKDNSTTILSEELTQRVVVERTEHGTHTTYYTMMGGIGVNELNPDGSEKSGYWIRKMQEANGLFDPLYISARARGRWSYLQGFAEHNSYMSYDYVGTEKNRYIIFNDDDKNFDREEDEKKRKVVIKTKKLNTICYSLNGPGVNKFFLFGDPGDEDKSNSLHIDASDYDKENNVYATLMVERERKDRVAKLVWIKFQ